MDNMTYSCSARYELRMRERQVGGNGDFVQEIVTVHQLVSLPRWLDVRTTVPFSSRVLS